MSRVISPGSPALHGIYYRILVKILCISAAMATSGALAEVSQTPLFLPQPVQPNIMYTLDNSGSMGWGSLTGFDGTNEYDDSKRAYYSGSYNGMWYNPTITYKPAVNYDGSSFAASVPNKALDNPFLTSSGTTDLTATCYTASALPSLPTPICIAKSEYTALISKSAFYYVWNGSTSIAVNNPSDAAFPTRVNIMPTITTYGRATSRTDCDTGSTCTYDQEIQNFANWYSFYKTRILMQKTAMGQAFASLDPVQTGTYTPRFRVGFNTINKPGSTSPNTAVSDGAGWLTIRAFSTTQKQSFYTKLYAISPNGGTPLRTQMNRIGQLYKGTLPGLDYTVTGNDPYHLSATDSTLVSCRASYHIMSTDGYWNDSYNGVGDVDGDGYSNTLADIAAYYYKTDLRTTLTDNVKFKLGAKDNAAYQHMTTFTIGLGANGTFAYDPNYEAVSPAFTETSAGGSAWPKVTADQSSTIDDLWHAAVNGRGHYYSAKNPIELRDGLSAALKAIDNQTGAAAGIGISNSNVIDGDAYVYQPSFESGIWLGHLKAYSLDIAGNLITPAAWDAATQLPIWSTRNIVTWNSTTSAAVTFNWGNLTTAQQTVLGTSDVMDYLKGRADNEQTVAGQGPGTYRYRATKLGDIVNSAPLYVKNSSFGYQMLSGTNSGASTYSTFVGTARTPMVYVGANDGMLHAFDAGTGVEKFAYVPNSVYDNLQSLSDPDYPHRYFVDGPLAEGDAYNGTDWKKYLVGSTGAGARSVFALDITTPASLGASSVKWEKTAGETGFSDLGHVLGRMAVVRLTTGAWAVVFGNGYNDNTNGNSVLYIVSIVDGSLIKAITVGTTTGGLATPALLFNDKRELITAYAGDLGGNLWKFDLSGAVGDWAGSKLFTATNGTQVQPIVQKPILEEHPNGGYIVSVGTGKFFDTSDKANTDVQSLYGIWDKPDSTGSVARTSLVPQTLTATTGGRTLSNTSIDWSTKRGWYINLIGSGERAVGDLLIDNNLILLATTFAPTTSLCDGGGVSQFMGFNYLTGGASNNVIFKSSNVAMVDGSGKYLSSIAIAGTTSSPVSINLGKGQRIFKFNSIDGQPVDVPAQIGVKPFRTWHQLTIK